MHAQEERTVRNNALANRVILLLLVMLVVALIVLTSAVRLLPPPPGPPTPTAPTILDRPEGRPRILH
jgi:hypothetical protein